MEESCEGVEHTLLDGLGFIDALRHYLRFDGHLNVPGTNHIHAPRCLPGQAGSRADLKIVLDFAYQLRTGRELAINSLRHDKQCDPARLKHQVAVNIRQALRTRYASPIGLSGKPFKVRGCDCVLTVPDGLWSTVF